jgi:hypothetical protein
MDTGSREENASNKNLEPRSDSIGTEMALGVKMVDKDRYLHRHRNADLGGLRRAEEEVLKEHVARCVEHALAGGDRAEQRKKIAEPVAVVGPAE